MPKNPKNSIFWLTGSWPVAFFGNILAIKWERKVLETQIWYQKKALVEQNQNKVLWEQLNNYNMLKSPKNTIFSPKIAISRPQLTSNMTTFHFGYTPKMFFGTLQTPY